MTDREIIRYCTLAAGQNNVDAQVLLYAFFSQGKHTPANREMASVWEEGILNSGSADAIFKLAKWKMENGATLAERLSGKDLCKKAADMGCGDAVQYQEERTAPPPPVSPPRTVNTRSTEDRSDLAPLINRMRALKCKHADSAEQQRHLLVLLPMIQDGADVDVTTSDSGGAHGPSLLMRHRKPEHHQMVGLPRGQRQRHGRQRGYSAGRGGGRQPGRNHPIAD